MFNDERINAECGRIYSRGILLAVLVTLVYVLSRTVTLVMQGTLHTVVTYTEVVILLLGIGILLMGAIRFAGQRDERVEFERHMFYKKAAKVFVIAVFGAYILTIPFTTEEMLGGQYHNHLLILLEVVGYLYLFYSFKTKEININYSFICESGWEYYSRVFLNIGTLCLGLLPPFVLAASWELVLHQSFAGVLTILLAYVSSALGLSIEYFFISLVEKTSYDSIDGKRFTLGVRITMLVCLTVEFLLACLQCIYVYFVTGNLQDIPGIKNVGTVIAIVSQQRVRMEFLLTVVVGLAICHIMTQVKKRGLIYKVCSVKMLLLCLSAMEATLMPIWYRAVSQNTIVFLVNNVDPWLSFVGFAISIVLWVLFVSALNKELGITRALWVIPVLKVAMVFLNIFFTLQSMLRVGTYIQYAAEMACLVLLTVVLWNYKGFNTEESEITEFQT